MDNRKISEKVINTDKFQKYESISCLGNGYIGIRNSLEEDYVQSHRNTFINRVFDAPANEVSELASLPDVTNFEIFIDGERFDMLTADITEYERHLDMQNGEAVRKALDSVEAYKEARIPYARNHDASFCEDYGGEYTVDVHRIFRDFDADVNNCNSYDFEETDKYILSTEAVGTKTFYRLGSRIEPGKKREFF